jgi:hypothetical protein
VDGDEVDIRVRWETDDGRHDVPVGQLIYQEGTEARADRWVYTGSMFSPEGIYLAQDFGPLIGFVHDPVAIIDHAAGIGLNAWGSVLVSEDHPEVGSAITLSIRHVVSAAETATTGDGTASAPIPPVVP